MMALLFSTAGSAEFFEVELLVTTQVRFWVLQIVKNKTEGAAPTAPRRKEPNRDVQGALNTPHPNCFSVFMPDRSGVTKF
jgi:hypothetical protein